MKKETNTMLLIISAILGVAALVLIVVSIVGEFKTNWVLAAGLGCVALGSLINTISMIKNRKKKEIAKSGFDKPLQDLSIRNIASSRMLEKCGYTKEGLIRQGKMVNTWCDYYVYGILVSDIQ